MANVGNSKARKPRPTGSPPEWRSTAVGPALCSRVSQALTGAQWSVVRPKLQPRLPFQGQANFDSQVGKIFCVWQPLHKWLWCSHLLTDVDRKALSAESCIQFLLQTRKPAFAPCLCPGESPGCKRTPPSLLLSGESMESRPAVPPTVPMTHSLELPTRRRPGGHLRVNLRSHSDGPLRAGGSSRTAP